MSIIVAEMHDNVTKITPFALYCYANRGPEMRLRQVVGLIEKHLVKRPNDKVASGCRAGLLMQLGERSHPEKKSDLYRPLAMRIQEAVLNEIRIQEMGKILFVHGTSLAQIGAGAAFDQKARCRLMQFLGDCKDDGTPSYCKYEAMIVLSIVEQENQKFGDSKSLFINAQNKIGRIHAVWLFEDYMRLRREAA